MNKLTEFKYFISTNNFHLIMVTETWIKDESIIISEITLNGKYEAIFANRQYRSGGGCLILVLKCIPFKVRYNYTKLLKLF